MHIISSVVDCRNLGTQVHLYFKTFSGICQRNSVGLKNADTRGALCHGKTPPCPDPEVGTGGPDPPEKSQK